MRTAIVVDRRYEAHDPGPGHPESPQRIRAIADLLASYRRDGLVDVAPRAATADDIALNHGAAHIERVEATAGRPFFAFDADTPTSARSYETALLATGGYLEILDAIMSGTVENGFAFVRPPGHHAEADRAMGFCLFNSVAIGARHLRARHGIDRVLIVDWDVHHGNGTQRSFYDDPSVLYVSTHQFPFYPGTGAATEVGAGEGAGRTVNIPFPAGCGDDEFVAGFTRVVEPIAAQFQPQFVLISAGFDAHRRDPLAGMQMTEAGYTALTRVLMRVANTHAGGRVAAILEGGYDLRALGASTAAVLDELGGRATDDAIATPRPHAGVLTPAVAAHRRYWDLPSQNS